MCRGLRETRRIFENGGQPKAGLGPQAGGTPVSKGRVCVTRRESGVFWWCEFRARFVDSPLSSERGLIHARTFLPCVFLPGVGYNDCNSEIAGASMGSSVWVHV